MNHLSFLALLQNRLMLDSNCEGEPLSLRASRNFLPVKTTNNCLKQGGKIQTRDRSNRWDRRGGKATSPRPRAPSTFSLHQPIPGWLHCWSRSRVPALFGPRPAPPSPHSSGQTRPSYKSRLRARGPGHLEQLCRGDCTIRPARPAPTGARRRQQSQHCDLGPFAGYGCVLGLSPQVGKRSAGRRGVGPGYGRPGKGGTRTRCIRGSVTTRVPTVWSKPGRLRAAGAGDASCFGSKALSPELGPSLTKLENRFEVCFAAL